ncbi:MAG: TetR/AcrR family transcriptional regulator [Deltaproteobacteria bacterium]|nr:TetR/AcrR family transcriptional regulator [Deltaproteobacteria bacterium]
MKAQVLRKKRKPTSQVTDEKRLLEGKERIAAAAAALFLDGGYHSTSVREIAQKAGLSVGSVFNYFTSKEEILFFLFSRNQERTEAALRDQRAEFERLKEEGVDPKELLLLAYEPYVRLNDELRRYTVLGYQELKSLTVAERRRILEGEERIQHFIEEVIAYGVEKGAFPPGDVDLKAHCLMILGQSWAVRRWALKRFAKVDDYLSALKLIALGVVESETPHPDGVPMVTTEQQRAPVHQERGTLL